MLHTIATVPVPCMIEWLELIELASRDDVEPRLTAYLGRSSSISCWSKKG